VAANLRNSFLFSFGQLSSGISIRFGADVCTSKHVINILIECLVPAIRHLCKYSKEIHTRKKKDCRMRISLGTITHMELVQYFFSEPVRLTHLK